MPDKTIFHPCPLKCQGPMEFLPINLLIYNFKEKLNNNLQLNHLIYFIQNQFNPYLNPLIKEAIQQPNHSTLVKVI